MNTYPLTNCHIAVHIITNASLSILQPQTIWVVSTSRSALREVRPPNKAKIFGVRNRVLAQAATLVCHDVKTQT